MAFLTPTPPDTKTCPAKIDRNGCAGEFIRWSVAVRPTNGETVNSQGAGSAQAPTNPHSNGRIK